MAIGERKVATRTKRSFERHNDSNVFSSQVPKSSWANWAFWSPGLFGDPAASGATSDWSRIVDRDGIRGVGRGDVATGELGPVGLGVVGVVGEAGRVGVALM